jgi:hypothetical protein
MVKKPIAVLPMTPLEETRVKMEEPDLPRIHHETAYARSRT